MSYPPDALPLQKPNTGTAKILKQAITITLFRMKPELPIVELNTGVISDNLNGVNQHSSEKFLGREFVAYGGIITGIKTIKVTLTVR
ncbi:hypothetical protein GCM10027217_27080 [Pseudomaricurvus hydrocarbonicus]